MSTYVLIQEICRFKRGPEVQCFQMLGFGPCFEITESSSSVMFRYFTFCLLVCFTSETYLGSQAAYYVRYFQQMFVCNYILFFACCMSCLTHPSDLTLNSTW